MATVVRWNPFREIAAIQNAFDRALDAQQQREYRRSNGVTFPLDVWESDQNYTIRATLPGFAIDDIHVTWHEGVLNISGDVKRPELPEGYQARISENFYGNFSRSLTLPVAIDAENVETSYENGVLTLNLPKVPEAQPRQISIKSKLN